MTHIQLLNLQSQNTDDIYLLSQGAFYHAFESGAYRLNAICGYKVRPTPHGDMAGFPISAIDKVVAHIIASLPNHIVHTEALAPNHLIIKIIPL